MSLENLSRRDVATRHGVLELRGRPEAFASDRPVVLAVSGLFAGSDDLSRTPEVLDIYADGAVLPLQRATTLAGLPLTAYAEAVADLIEATFAGRRVVLFGASVGATICLAVRSPHVCRVVAVEPVLDTGKLWPILDGVRSALAEAPDEPHARARRELFGVSATSVEGRDYRGVLDGLVAPTDVVLGAEPLMPQRQAPALPSLVDAPERALLSAHDRVRLHVVAGVGHDVQVKAPKQVAEVLREACRRASALHVYDPRDLDEALIEATPPDVGELAYWGPRGEAFRAAYRARNPASRVLVLDGTPPAEAAFDVLVLGAVPPNDVFAALTPRLRAGGLVVARWRFVPEALLQPPRLAELGLAPADRVEEGGSAVVRLRRSADPPIPRLYLQLSTFAPLLMDVRTRLPAQVLRGFADLQVAYQAPPFELPSLRADRPKVVVMQRPGEQDPDRWRNFMARCIKDGWVVVLEYDDHPYVIGEVQSGRPREAGYDIGPEMQRFAYVHAVQTSTPPLVEAFRALNPDVALFPNAAFELLPFPDGPPSHRVFYGGVLRGEFAVAVARTLGPVAEEFPDVEFVVIGDRAVFDALPGAAKTLHRYMSYEAYLGLMRRCAVSLSPMEDRPLRETKSDAKYLDASRAGVLTIASPVVYDRTIDHGRNGLIAATLRDWPELLAAALREPDAHRAMARRAWEDVRDHRMFGPQADERRLWYWSLWNRRNELNEAVMARIPGLRETVAAL